MKRGSIHLEMMIAFMMFSIFLLLLFVFLKPIESKALPQELNTRIIWDFKELNSVNLSEFFIKLNSPTQAPCYEIDIGPEVKFPRTNVLVKDTSLKKVPAKLEQTLIIENPNQQGSYFILMSPEFKDSNIQCNPIQTSFEIGGIYERKALSYTKIKQMSSEYYNQYDSLKKKFGIPQIFDFAITSPDMPEIDMKKEIPATVEVLSKENVFEVIKPDGKIINARFIFKTW